MTTPNDNSQAPKRAEKLLPLAGLDVLRGTYCSQAEADEAISLLEERNPGLLLAMLAGEQARGPEYSNLALHVLEWLSGQSSPGFKPPSSPLGKLDLVAELGRRLRKTYGFPDLRPQGKPLAAGPDAPLPPLAALDVDRAAKRHGLTQNIADRLLQASYKARPDLWFVFAEEYRHGLRLEASGALRGQLYELLFRDFPSIDKIWIPNDLYLEAVGRMELMCGLSE